MIKLGLSRHVSAHCGKGGILLKKNEPADLDLNTVFQRDVDGKWHEQVSSETASCYTAFIH